MQEYIKVFNIVIYLYGIFSLLGIINSFGLVMYVNKKEKIDKYNLIIIFLMVMLFYYLGSKVVNMIEQRNINFTLSKGFTYTGGVFAGIVSIYLLSKIFEYKFDSLLSVLVVIFPTIYFFSKIGCFINGCCSGILLIPIQLIESFLGLFLTIQILRLKIKNKNNMQIIAFYFITYGLVRFILDFLRTSTNSIIFNLTITQFICIILFFIGIIILIMKKKEFI